jgi:hypothetical protein
MKSVFMRLLAVVLALQPALGPRLSAADAPDGFAFTDKVVLAYYYIWFQEDDWLKPAAAGGRQEGLAGLHPLVGAYNYVDLTAEFVRLFKGRK